MARFKYFNGDIELIRVWHDSKTNRFFGEDPSFEPRFDREAGKWVRRTLAAERVVRMKSNPSRHDCDARCFNATGRTMNCECSCGGKNHGRGAFSCVAVAA